MKPRIGTSHVAFIAGTLGALVLAAMPSCADDGPTVEACTAIPAGGCPLSRGVACADETCEAVYACRPGNVWELDHMCPPRDGGVRREAGTDASLDASAPFDAGADAPPGANGGPGCGPLQAPDCALGLALACSAGCCGCEDLFVCDNGGWTYWSTCE